MTVLECKDLSRDIGKRNIVNKINMRVNEGEIFGFLGPNGAGKTTTIRMITGLIKTTSGEITIMGHSIEKERNKALSYIGAIVENPEFYPYMTGWQNLLQFARMDKRISEDRMHEVVAKVRLSGRIHDKVKTYSLGMRQRLGVAQAILHKPKLLVLDEPTNGLDPAGIIEFRQMIRAFAREDNLAVFVSSHILSEVEQLCDRAAIINHGAIQSMVDLGKKDDEEVWTSFKIRNIETLKNTLKSLTYLKRYEIQDNEVIADIEKNLIPDMVKYLAANGAEIEQVMPKAAGLEEKFMKIVGGIK